jgi:hypothetical protein
MLVYFKLGALVSTWMTRERDIDAPDDGFNLEQYVFRKTRDLNRRTRGLVPTEELSVDPVHGRKVIHVLDEYLLFLSAPPPAYIQRSTYGSLRDLAESRASALDDGLKIRESLLSLLLDPAFDNLHRARDEWDAA